MRRLVIFVVFLLLTLALPIAAPAHHVTFPAELEEYLEPALDGTSWQSVGSEADIHSDNMKLIANFDDGGSYTEGSDLAFWRDIAVMGNYNGFRLVNISDPAHPYEMGQFDCPGLQGDVSIWKNLVFMSVDQTRKSADCGAARASTTDEINRQYFEGIRIVSIADPANPQQIHAVRTDCGSHTHTLVPDLANNRVLLYVLSYPLGVQTPDCNAESHHKISVVEVPLANPRQARVISTPDVSPAIGCHDVTVFIPGKLAAAACITETQLWDISDPANPRVLPTGHIVNPAINIHHSTTFSWDGATLVIGDELGGAAVAPGCMDGDEHVPLGALWFYDIRGVGAGSPAVPVVKGTFSIPQEESATRCTAHNFNTIPLKTDRDILVSAWYFGGTTVVDFTDPSNPQQLGYYIPKENPLPAEAWSSYWYRGFIYANNFMGGSGGHSRGLDVMAIGHPDLHHKVTYKLPYLNPQTMEPLPQK